jgi:hypothetical protein
VLRADRLIVQNTHADQELGHWLRSPETFESDGIPIVGGVGVAAFHRVPFVECELSDGRTREKQAYPGSGAEIAGHPLLSVLCTPRNDMAAWLCAGRALAAVLLQVTRAGGNASYLNQPVEVPAMRVLLREQPTLAGVPQVVLRMGKGGIVTPTRRRALAS